MLTKASRRRQAVSPRFILLDIKEGWRKWLGPDRAVVCKRDRDISEVLKIATTDSLWISSSPQMPEALLRAMSQAPGTIQGVSHRWGNLLTLESPRPSAVPFLRSLFHDLIGESAGFKWLPSDQLCQVLAGDSVAARDVFIGGVSDTDFGLLTLVRGNFDRITVPLALFRPSGTSKPEFGRFELDDFGHAVRFGEYEASAHFILYEADRNYRKRLKQKQLAESRGFGASLRRLRRLKRISQSEFAGLSARTIGRIESELVAKPHGTTLRVISQTLGVAPDEIESY